MKRCPECRRDYYDDTLLYCLDDGNALLEGPAVSVPPASAGGQFDDEPQTAILHTTDAVGEAPTRAQIHSTEAESKTAILQSTVDLRVRVRSRLNKPHFALRLCIPKKFKKLT
ncbi:hypothetical protein [Leptolyngbya sp. 7M]|uniref:hypothetical protein n=1 Tax=Leptolyngbya sp. 7M TaxID=2812896 RepID=UPI001B8B2C72|nr:hypothetical protein [Leptolyngbya sp. 7M]QYO63230.1 hypothetical protein JVX88_25275 [Leptolyngbya sp. 7M]